MSQTPPAGEGGLRPSPTAIPTTRVRAIDVEAYPVLEVEYEEELMQLFREVGGGSGILPEDIAGAIFECPTYLLARLERARKALREVEQAIRVVRSEELAKEEPRGED